MSRLYIKASSDARQSEITARGNEKITGLITWGHKDSPKTAFNFDVTWTKENDKPSIRLYIAGELKDQTEIIQ